MILGGGLGLMLAMASIRWMLGAYHAADSTLSSSSSLYNSVDAPSLLWLPTTRQDADNDKGDRHLIEQQQQHQQHVIILNVEPITEEEENAKNVGSLSQRDRRRHVKEQQQEKKDKAAIVEEKEEEDSPAAHAQWMCPVQYTDRLIRHEQGKMIVKKGYELPPRTETALQHHTAYLLSTITGSARSSDGIPLGDARLLHALVRGVCRSAITQTGGCRTAETGFALARSTIAILEGQQAAWQDIRKSNNNDNNNNNNIGDVVQMTTTKPPNLEHYAVDPFQQSLYDNVGMRSVSNYLRRISYGATNSSLSKSAAAADNNDKDPTVQVALFRETAVLTLSHWVTHTHTCLDVLFLDDGHRFEKNIMELSLAIPLVAVGGLIILHDIWMASIQATAAWIDTNLGGVLKRVKQRISRNMLVLIKVSPRDERAWDHFVPFNTQFNNTGF